MGLVSTLSPTTASAAGPVDLSKSTISVEQNVVNADQKIKATITARDAQGAPVSGQKVDVTGNHVVVSVTPRGGCTTGTDGSCQVEAFITGSAVVNGKDGALTATINGQNLAGSPYPVLWSNQHGNARWGSITAPTNMVVGQAYPVTISVAYNQGGAPFAGQDVWLKCGADASICSFSPAASGKTGSDGTYHASVTLNRQPTAPVGLVGYFSAGNDRIPGIFVHDLPIIAGAPVVTQPQASPANSELSVTPDRPLYVGEQAANQYAATVTVRDQANQALSGVPVTFGVTRGDGSPVDGSKTRLSATSCTSEANGQCASPVTLTSTQAGDFIITAKIADPANNDAATDVRNSGWAVKYAPGGMTPNPSCDGTNFTVSRTSAPVGTWVTAQAYITDEYCNPVGPDRSVSITLTGDARFENGLTMANRATDPDSKVTVKFTDTTAETVTVSATIPGHIRNSPQSVQFTAGDLCVIEDGCDPGPQVPAERRTRVEVTSNNATADGVATNTITAHAFDILGNPLTGGATFTLTPQDADLIGLPGQIRTGDTGTGTATAASAVPGEHLVKAFIGSTELNQTGSPLKLNYRARAADKAASSLTLRTVDSTGQVVTGNMVSVTAGQEVTAMVAVRDAAHAPIDGVQVRIQGNGNVDDGAIFADTVCTSGESGPGECFVPFTSAVAQVVDVWALISVGNDWVDVADSPSTAVFAAGSVSADQSSVTVDPSRTTVGAPVTVTVMVRDEHGNAVDGLTEADFKLSGIPSGSTPPLQFSDFTARGDDRYTFTTTSQFKGGFTIETVVDGVVLDQKPEVVFVSGPVCVTNCDPRDNPATDDQDESTNHTRFEVFANGAHADGSSADAVTALAFDRLGNVVDLIDADGAPVVIPVELTDTTATPGLTGMLSPAKATGIIGAAGSVTLGFTSTVAGTYDVEGTINGQRPSTSVIAPRLFFVRGGVDASRSSLTVSANAAVVGGPVPATVTVRDQQDNPVGGIVVALENDFKSGQMPWSCETNSTPGPEFGTCEFELTSYLIGDYQVRALIGGVDVQDSPAQIQFVASNVCSSDCAPVDDPTTQDEDESQTHYTHVRVTTVATPPADGRTPNEVTAWAYDHYGNPVRNATVATTTITDTLTVTKGEAQTGPDGTATLEYTSLTAGEAQARVMIDGVEVKNQPGRPALGHSPVTMEFTNGTAVADRSWVEIRPATSQPVDSTFTITAHVYDVHDNPVQFEQVKFVSSNPADAVLTGAGGTGTQADPVTCVTLADGTCSVSLNSTKAGTYSVAATLKAGDKPTELRSSPVFATFTPGPLCLPADCSADPGAPVTSARVVTNGAKADGQAQDLVEVLAYDRHGNPIPGIDVGSTTADADLIIQPGNTITPTDANGRATVWYASTVAGKYEAQVTTTDPRDPATPVTGQPDGSPVTLSFGDGVGDASKSSFSITPKVAGLTSPLVVGIDDPNTYQVTATVRDAHNQPVSGAVVSFANVEAGPVWAQGETTCTTVADGACSAYISSTVAGTYTVTAALAGDVIESGKPAAWTADEVCFTQDGCEPEDPDSSLISRVKVTTDFQVADGMTADVISVWAYDRWGNPKTGASVNPDTTDRTLRIDSGAHAGVDDQGTATVNARSTVAGAHPATVQIDGRPSGGVPVTLNFVAGAVDPNTSKLTVDPVRQVAGSPVTVTVAANDVQGNPILDLAVDDFALTGVAVGGDLPELVFTGFASPEPGVYTFTTTSKLVAEFQLGATVRGVQLADTPTVEFYAGAVCVANCEPVDPNNVTRFEMAANDQVADGSAQDTARAYAFDHYGNAVDQASVEVADVTTAPALVGKLTPANQSTRSGPDGTAQVAWSSTVAGTYSALGKIDGLTPVTGALDKIRFSNGEADPDKSTLEITPTGSQVVDSLFTAKATIRDAQRNPVASAVVSWTTDAPAGFGDGKTTTTCETDQDGVCFVTVTSALVGVYDVHATIPVAGAPVDLGGDQDSAKASPQSVEFTHGDVCVTNCHPVDDPRTPEPEDETNVTWAEVTRDNQVADGRSTDEVTVHAYDANGNVVPEAVVVSTPASGMTAVNTTDKTGGDGTVVAKFTAETKGTYAVDITVDGQTGFPGARSQLTFVNSTPAADKSNLTITPNDGDPTMGRGLEAGSTYTVTATVRDAHDNTVDGATVGFVLPNGVTSTATDQSTGTTSCLTLGSGQCSIAVTSTIAATYEIAGEMSGAALANTVTAPFVAGPVDASMSYVEVTHDGARDDGTQRNTVTVHALDRFGNPVAGATVGSTSDESALTIQPDIAQTGTAGATTVWYTSTVAGAHDADVTVDGLTPKNSPVTLHFGSGSGDPVRSDWVITPDGPLTVGVDTASQYTLTATVRDVFGDPADGTVVQFTTDSDSTSWGAARSATCVAGESGEPGVCSVTVSSTRAGTYPFVAQLTNGQIGQAQNRAWQADEVCADGCAPEDGVTATTMVTVTTPDGVRADGVARNRAQVETYDKWGNPVAGVIVQSSARQEGTLTVQSGIDATDATGRSTIWYASTTVGTHQADVTVTDRTAASKTPTGSPVDLVFLPGAPDTGRSGLTVTPSTQTVGETVTATARVVDDRDYPLSGVQVWFDATGAATVSDQATCTTVDGECSVTVSDRVAERIDVDAKIDQTNPLTGAPVKVAIGVKPVEFVTGCLPGIDPNCRYDDSVDDDHRTRVQVTKDAQPAGGGVDLATLWLFDLYGNPVSEVTPATVPSVDSLTASAVATTNVAGLADLEYVSTVDGAFTATVTVKGEPVVFVPQPGGPLDGDASEIAQRSSPVTLAFMDRTKPNPPVITGPVDGTVTRDQPVIVTGTGEPGAWLDLREGDEVLCHVQVDQAGTWSCDPGLREGVHTVVADQTDPSGNVSDKSNPVTVTIDRTAPGKPIIIEPSPGDVTNDSTPVVSGTGDEPGNTIIVSDENGDELCRAEVGDDKTWSCAVPDDKALTDGDHVIDAVETDPAGNVSDPAEVPFVVDTVAPQAPVIQVANGMEITGTAEPGTTVTVTVPGVNDPVTGVPVDDQGRWTIPTPEGARNGVVTAVSIDDAGNVSPPATKDLVIEVDAPVIEVANGTTISGTSKPGTATVTVTVPLEDGTSQVVVATPDAEGDWAVPTPDDALDGSIVTAVAADPAGNTSGETQKVIDTFTPDPVIEIANGTVISGTAEGGASVVVKVPLTDGSVATVTVTADPDGAWSIPTPERAVDGSTVTAQATDPAGNVSGEASKVIDLGKPDAPHVTSPAPGDQINDATPVVTGDQGEPGNEIVVRDDDDRELCTTTVLPDGTWSCQIPDDRPLPEGPANLVVTEEDPAGNVSDPTEVPVVVDTTPPDAPHVVDPGVGDLISDATPVVTGDQGEPGNEIVVEDDQGRELCTTTVQADGTWSCQIPDDRPLSEGPANLVVTETDPAGNVSDETRVPVVVDTIAPDAPVIEVANGDQISGTAEPGARVTVTIPGVNDPIDTVADSQGRWSVPTPSEAVDGDVKAVATDPAGNVSAEATKSLDVTPPAPPRIDIADEIEVTGGLDSSEPGATITVTWPDGSTSRTVVDDEGGWSVPTPPGMMPGEISVTATDEAGNVSDPSLGDLVFHGPVDAAGIALAVSTKATHVWYQGEVVPYAFTTTNTGTVALADVQLSESVKYMELDETCSDYIGVILPGESVTCTGNYTVPQEDMDHGDVTHEVRVVGVPVVAVPLSTPMARASVNQVFASAGATPEVVSTMASVEATARVTTPVVQAPAINLVKSVPSGSYDKAGSLVTYLFTVKNVGNVTLRDVVVSDPKPGVQLDGTCGALGAIAPGSTVQCLGTYVVTDADVQAGQIMNTAMAEGMSPIAPDDPTLGLVTDDSTAVAVANTVPPQVAAPAAPVVAPTGGSLDTASIPSSAWFAILLLTAGLSVGCLIRSPRKAS
ncbi:MAG: Ig-like domain-containing protein [Propionibacteriaceae bacterium]|nr:Ig-like domain-containing protein [Propionibacteriaceae bacterium]